MPKNKARRAAQRQAHQTSKSSSPDAAPACPSLTSPIPEQPANQPEAPPQLGPEHHRPATPAQVAANQQNAAHSTGPVTPEGKAAVAQNRLTHGLAGQFRLLADEDPEDLRLLTESIYAEHTPTDETEKRLANSIIQHYWRMQRALRRQDELLMEHSPATEVDNQRLALFLRYQSTHERSYYKALRELQNLKQQKQKEQIGFESQTRTQETHDARIRLAHAKASNLEVIASGRQYIEAPLPGRTRIPLPEVAKACSTAIATLIHAEQFKTAAACAESEL